MRKIIIIPILTIFIMVSFIIICYVLDKDIHYDYLCSDDGTKTLTIIEYHKLSEPEHKCKYIINGNVEKDGKLPTKNYIKISFDTDPIWINWNENGKIIIIYGMGEIIDNKISTDLIEIKRAYSDEDFKKLTGNNINKYKEIYLNKWRL